MAVLQVQRATKEGLTVVYTAAGTTGDKFANDGKTEARIRNDSNETITVTVKAQAPCNQGHIHDILVSIPALSEKSISDIEPAWYNNHDGQAEIEYSNTTNITIAVVQSG